MTDDDVQSSDRRTLLKSAATLGAAAFSMRWSSHGSDLELSFDISPLPP